MDLRSPAGAWGGDWWEEPPEKNLTPAQENPPSAPPRDSEKLWPGLMSFREALGHGAPTQACSQSHQTSRSVSARPALGHGPRPHTLHLTAHPGRRSSCTDRSPFCAAAERPAHSPLADFRVNVQQGASDQVAGRGAEDGRRVEDGCKGSRAVGRLPPPLPTGGPEKPPQHSCTRPPSAREWTL